MHPITEKIYEAIKNYANPYALQDRVDKVVREELEKIAEELDKNCVYHHFKKNREILGLEKFINGIEDLQNITLFKSNTFGCLGPGFEQTAKQAPTQESCNHEFIERLDWDKLQCKKCFLWKEKIYKTAQESGEWCEHIHLDSNGRHYCNNVLVDSVDYKDVWKQCPICFSPRPAKKSLRDSLLDKFELIIEKYSYSKSGKGRSGYLISDKVIYELAEIAEEVFMEHK